MLITVTVFGFVLRARERGPAVKQSRISPALGSDFRAKTLQFRPVFIHFIQLMNDQMTDEYPFWGTSRSSISCCKRMMASRTGVRLPLYLAANTFSFMASPGWNTP